MRISTLTPAIPSVSSGMLFSKAVAWLLLIGCLSCSQKPAETETRTAETENTGGVAFPEPVAAAAYSFEVLDAPEGTFGYQILQDGKPLIRQINKPGAAGTTGFATKRQAEHAAQLMIDKLRSHQMPPTLTPEELQKIESL